MGELFAVLSALGFALANVMVRKGTTYSSQNNGAFLSILLTLLISGTIVLGRTFFIGWTSINKQGMAWFILAGILTAYLGRTLLYSSIQHLGSVRATAVKRLNPFFAVILGVLLLGDQVTSSLLIGMLFIFFSFSILIYEAAQHTQVFNKEIGATQRTSDLGHSTNSSGIFIKTQQKVRFSAHIGYMYGPISALCYASGYVARKYGLLEIPDPFLGTMVGAFVGALVFLLLSLFRKGNRMILKTTFNRFEPYLFGAGVATSLGQIFYFIALTHIDVSKVALLTSIEVILTLLLSAFIFKTKESLTRKALLATLFSIAGAITIALK